MSSAPHGFCDGAIGLGGATEGPSRAEDSIARPGLYVPIDGGTGSHLALTTDRAFERQLRRCDANPQDVSFADVLAEWAATPASQLGESTTAVAGLQGDAVSWVRAGEPCGG